MASDEWIKTDHLIYEDEDYTFLVTLWLSKDGLRLPFVHLYVRRFSPSVFKRIHRGFEAFLKTVTESLYAQGTTDDAKWERFVRSFGFEPLDNVKYPCTDGVERRVFWRKQ